MPPKTFSADGRLPIHELYDAYNRLVSEFGWFSEVIYTQDFDLPIVVLTTKVKGPALWIFAGIHGEEPAGPNALAQNIDTLGHLGEQLPIVLFPMCNPAGYVKDWRYPNERRDWKKGRCVTDSEYLLPDLKNPLQPRIPTKPGPEAIAITTKVLELMKEYPPVLSIDHHEDESLHESYMYSQGKKGANDPVAQRSIAVLSSAGIPLQLRGKTRFGEEVHDGVIGRVTDGSIDELLSAEHIIVGGQLLAGPSARSVIVIETPTRDVPLQTRVLGHTKIIQSYEELFHLAQLQ